MSDLGKSLIQSINEARLIASSKLDAARTINVDVPDIVAIRKSLKLSQAQFAERFHLPAASVRDWEQGRRSPDTAARNLLAVINYAPETVARALSER
jgi:putative transcriptional regulator